MSTPQTTKEEKENDQEKEQHFLEGIHRLHGEVEKNLQRAQQKYKARHDRHRVEANFQEGDLVWLHLSKEQLKGEGKKLKPIRYGPFKILRKIGDNACQLDLPPYMDIYSVVNVEHLKLFEPSMLDDDFDTILPSMEDLVYKREAPLGEDVILEKKIITTRRGTKETFRVGQKGQRASASKWYTRESDQAQFPHLQFAKPAGAGSF